MQFLKRSSSYISDLAKHLGIQPHGNLWAQLLIMVGFAKDADRCPKCGSKDLMRSRRRNFIERGLSNVMLPFRCRRCYSRFFRVRQQEVTSSQPKPLPPHVAA